jgi:formylglycine-generating enzyme required for sulfatase activity
MHRATAFLGLLAGCADPASPPGMVLVPGGTFVMGSDRDAFSFEGPAHEADVAPYWLDRNEVTVAQFAAFCEATGYRTDSERLGCSGVFDPESGAWRPVAGADWRHPQGPGSSASAEEPVVHVSWNDACAYGCWAKKRLPTEAEFEFALRGGRSGETYPWGEELQPNGRPRANLWQGRFPGEDLGLDGFRGVAPVGSYSPDRFGLVDVTGNVWEWCADWFDPVAYARRLCDGRYEPRTGTERVLRGGSWMCSENHCRGYRCAARSHATPDSALDNVGFRCARDP